MNSSVGATKTKQAAKHDSTVGLMTSESSTPDSVIEKERLEAVFRQHFEARFRALPKQDPVTSESADRISKNEDQEDEVDEWSGISEDEQEVEVIEHFTDSFRHDTVHDQQELRAFLSSKPPREASRSVKGPQKRSNEDDEGDENSASNIKNDLALQRLLAESHLLSRSQTDDIQSQGKARLKALDMRFQTLGSKDSLFTVQKMPMSMRKGMIQKKEERETRRRKEAKEANIILEREVKKRKKTREMTGSRNGRGIGAPSVGRFKGGVLRISRKDVDEIRNTRIHGSGRSR